MKAGRRKLTIDQIAWAQDRYQERMATLSANQIAKKLGVCHTTLMHTLFGERRVRAKAVRYGVLSDQGAYSHSGVGMDIAERS